jgi:hypothetical protein
MPERMNAQSRRPFLWPGLLLAALAAITSNGFGKQMLDVSGPGGGQSPPTLTFSPQSLDFGRQVTGRSGPIRRIAVTNSGNLKTFVNSAQLKGDNWQDFAIVDDTCSGKSIEPSEACLISIKFKPGRTGARHATLAVTLSASDVASNVELRGSGINSIDVAPFER